jgi:hypothetical protein
MPTIPRSRPTRGSIVGLADRMCETRALAPRTARAAPRRATAASAYRQKSRPTTMRTAIANAPLIFRDLRVAGVGKCADQRP